MSSQRTPQIRLYGNLGADPETHTLKARTNVQDVYDVVQDQVVTRESTTPEREIRTASLAVNGRDENNTEIVRWHRLVDFQSYLASCHKGDRLKVTGYFRERAYLQDGQEKVVREFVLTEQAEIQAKKPPFDKAA